MDARVLPPLATAIPAAPGAWLRLEASETSVSGGRLSNSVGSEVSECCTSFNQTLTWGANPSSTRGQSGFAEKRKAIA